MVGLFPTPSALGATFTPTSPYYKPAPKQTSEFPLKRSLWNAYSVADDAKQKAVKLTDAAAAEYEKASHKMQSKTGAIELYSAKYYAACTVGGILACVCQIY
jgi:solute carrier family 25 phosphate transporter 3